MIPPKSNQVAPWLFAQHKRSYTITVGQGHLEARFPSRGSRVVLRMMSVQETQRKGQKGIGSGYAALKKPD